MLLLLFLPCPLSDMYSKGKNHFNGWLCVLIKATQNTHTHTWWLVELSARIELKGNYKFCVGDYRWTRVPHCQPQLTEYQTGWKKLPPVPLLLNQFGKKWKRMLGWRRNICGGGASGTVRLPRSHRISFPRGPRPTTTWEQGQHFFFNFISIIIRGHHHKQALLGRWSLKSVWIPL